MFKSIIALYKHITTINGDISRSIILKSNRDEMIKLAKKLEEISNETIINNYCCEKRLIKASKKMRAKSC